VELLFDVPPYSGVRLSAGSPELDEVTEIELHAKSCRSGCRVELAAIERDNFSRQTVSRQLPLLQSWNVRPVLLTSHGGWTYHQNFGALGDSYVLSAARGPPPTPGPRGATTPPRRTSFRRRERSLTTDRRMRSTPIC
jgi:hypothetical protein